MSKRRRSPQRPDDAQGEKHARSAAAWGTASGILKRHRSLVIGLCLAAAIALVYWPVRHFEFTNYDDDVYVSANPVVQGGLTPRGLDWAFTTGHAGNWHPLTWVSHMLDCQWFGLNAGAHHLVNVLFHMVNTLLLFGVLKRMTAAVWRSALVAGLFALHPLHVESVAWVAERKDVLSTLFWLLTLWAYARYVQQPAVSDRRSEIGFRCPDLQPLTSGYYWLALWFFVCGLMSKAMVVTLPCVLLLLDWWPLGRVAKFKGQGSSSDQRASTLDARRSTALALVREKLPFFALAAVSCGLTLCMQQRGGAVASVELLPLRMRAANAVVAYVRYLGHALWPGGLAVFYPYQAWPWVTVLGAGVLLAGVSGVVMWRGRREPHLIVGWLWYLATLMPVIGLVQVGSQSLADRYTYVPLIGVFIMVAWAVPRRVGERRIGRMAASAIAAAALCLCAVLSARQVRHWENSATLFRHALKVTANNFLAHNNYGLALAEEGQFAAAITEYHAALRIKPDLQEAHNNLGSALMAQGKLAEAVVECKAALQLQPDYPEAHNNLGLALAAQGNPAQAVIEYRAALRIKPDYPEACNNLGNALADQGKAAEAVIEYQAALRIRPDYPDAHNNIGTVLAVEGELAEAIAQYQAALRIRPAYADAHSNLGDALAAQGKLAQATAEYETALRLKPDFAEAHCNLGGVLEAQGKLAEAVAEYETALRLKPDILEARYNLARILAAQGQAREALVQYREILRRSPDWAPALSRLAWLLATHTDAGVRNAAEAVVLAERLGAVTGHQQAQALDVLAAAYAEAGRFNDAVGVAQKAIELATSAGQQDLARQIQERLKLYQASRPCRE